MAITVKTLPATMITKDSARLNGLLVEKDLTALTFCSFDWGLTNAYGNTTGSQFKDAGQTFSVIITGLTSGTEYHFRAVAVGDR
jgi:hypothetical protein